MSIDRDELNSLVVDSWDSHNMNWDNPQPLGYVYWVAIYNALKQRVAAVDGFGDFGVKLPPYGQPITSTYISTILDTIFDIGFYYVDKQRCQTTQILNYINRFDLTNTLSGGCNLFPFTFHRQDILVKFKSLNRINNYEKDIPVWQAKQILIDLHNLLNQMIYCVGAKRTYTYRFGNLGYYYDQGQQIDVDSKVKGAFSDYKNQQLDASDYNSFTVESYNNMSYNRGRERQTVDPPFVGVKTIKLDDDAYDQYYITPYAFRGLCIKKLTDITADLVQFTYIAPVGDKVKDTVYTANYFGYDQGFNQKTLVSDTNGYIDLVEVIDVNDLSYPSAISKKTVVNGCLMLAAFALDYSRGFLFNNHQLDDLSNSDSE